MAKNKASKIAEDVAQKRVADLYTRLRENAAKIAYSTYGTQDPDMEKVDEELGNKPEE
jgi:Flp pilus assembly protein TadG